MKHRVEFLKLAAMLAMVVLVQAGFAPGAVAQQAEPDAYDADSYDYEPYDDYYNPAIRDPFEPVNRSIFKFNQVFDRVLMKPVAKAYVFVVPEFGRDRVSNAVNNFGEPVNMLNGFLQGDPKRGFTSMWRFIINSTLGIGGLFDFAGHNFGLNQVQEDFGQTMGVYGWGSGPYIVLPILGPSSGRDAFGRVVDIFSNPFNYVDNDAFVYGRFVVTAVDMRARNLELVDEIYRNSVDPYVTIRSGFAQRRKALIRNNEPPQGNVGF